MLVSWLVVFDEENKEKMSGIFRVMVVFWAAFVFTACGSEPEPDSRPDPEPTPNPQPEPEPGPEEEFAEDCTVVLEVSDGLVVGETWPEAISAKVRPLICWEVPQGVAEPAAENGWQILVEREESASGDLESGEWFVTGLEPSRREIHYGECEEPNQGCQEFEPLSEGTYFIHLLEPNNPAGPAASLVVEVE